MRDSACAAALTQELDRLELLPYTNPDAAVRPAEHAERVAELLGRVDLYQRARLVLADVAARRGDLTGSGRVGHEIYQWATDHGDEHVLARSHRFLAAFFHRLGDAASSLEHALRAAELTDDRTPVLLRVDHLQTLAVALSEAGSYDAARERLQIAVRLVEQTGELRLWLALLNNLADTELAAGEAERALATMRRMQALAAEHGLPLESLFLSTLAEVLVALGRLREAEEILLTAMQDSRTTDADAQAEVLLSLARIQRLQGAHGRASQTLGRCEELCDLSGFGRLRVEALQERADLLALDGRHGTAYALLKQAVGERANLSCLQRAARADVLQAVFETREARRDSSRFQELAVRDPLTGLYNRRHLEQCVPELLRAARKQAAPLTVALVDVDHFKQVNDTHSHEVGDRVLHAIAELLVSCFGDLGVNVRLGGDEFVVVLPGLTMVQAEQRCAALQRRLAAHPALPRVVTTSIGITSLTTGRETLPALLGEADAQLYNAKRQGRAQISCSRSPGDRPAIGENRGRLPAPTGLGTGNRPFLLVSDTGQHSVS